MHIDTSNAENGSVLRLNGAQIPMARASAQPRFRYAQQPGARDVTPRRRYVLGGLAGFRGNGATIKKNGIPNPNLIYPYAWRGAHHLGARRGAMNDV